MHLVRSSRSRTNRRQGVLYRGRASSSRLRNSPHGRRKHSLAQVRRWQPATHRLMTSGTGVGGSKGPSTTTTLLVAKPSAQMGKLARETFPDQPSNSSKQVPATLENFKHVIDAAKIGILFNIIK